MTTLLEELKQALAAELPDAAYQLDSPDMSTGSTWVDFQGGALDGLSVEIRPDLGYGLHLDPEPAYQGRPDKICKSARAVLDELKALNTAKPHQACEEPLGKSS